MNRHLYSVQLILPPPVCLITTVLVIVAGDVETLYTHQIEQMHCLKYHDLRLQLYNKHMFSISNTLRRKRRRRVW